MSNIRRNAMVLALNGYAPIEFWLNMPLSDLSAWIDENNILIEERKSK